MKISIIIPFYNVQEYIGQCIQSVKAQTFTDFECLLINDQSPDNSLAEAIKAIGDDPRFKIIEHSENKRQGGARNTGLSHAKGQWIAFLDSDDSWHNNFLEIMYTQAISSQAEVVTCRYENVNYQGNVVGLPNPILPNGVYTDKKLLIDFFLTYPNVWNKLYKREVWETLRFPENCFYEDLPTVFQIVFNATTFCFTDKVLIRYNLRDGSTTKHFSNRQITDRIKVFELIEHTFKGKNIPTHPALAIIYLSHIIYMVFDNVMRYNTNSKKTPLLQQLKTQWDKQFFNPRTIWSIRKNIGLPISFLLIIYYYTTPLSVFLFKLKHQIKK
jgi:glycosyltransferase